MNYSVKVNAKTVTLYHKRKQSCKNSTSFQEGRTVKKQRVDNTRSTYLSSAAVRRFKAHFLNWFSAVEAHRIACEIDKGIAPNFSNFMSFFALTLPSKQQHTDQELKSILNRFLQDIQQRRNLLFTYIWFAEKQKNGNLHFHLIGDGYYDKIDLQADWNKWMEKYGYIEPFYQKYGHRNPPSTRVDGLKEGLENYLVKDVFKKFQKEGVSGKLWSTSTNLPTVKSYENLESKERDYLKAVAKIKDKKAVFENEKNPFDSYFKIYFGFNPFALHLPNVERIITHYRRMFDLLYSRRNC